MSTDPREFEHPIDGPTPNELPTVLGVGSLTHEAIEAAARALFDLTPAENLAYATIHRWVDLHEQDRIYYRRLATAALTAAYPLIAAQAKGDAWGEGAADLNSQLREYRLGAHEVLTQKIKPSGGDDTRSLQLALVAAKHTESWLRARAATIEWKSE